MSANFYELLKYANTGIASPEMTYFDKMRALAMTGGGTIKTLTGIPPLSFTGNGSPLISLSMLGNAQQTGTPTPQNIIMPDLVGKRTSNLAQWEKGGINTTTGADEAYRPASQGGTCEQMRTLYTPCSGNTSYVLHTNTYPVQTLISYYDVDKNYISRSSVTPQGENRIFTTPETARYMRAQLAHITSDQIYPALVENPQFSITLGSTALPYEPYGYKIPFGIHGDNLCNQETLSTTRPSINTGQNAEIVKAFKSLTAGEAYTLSWDFQSSSTTGVRNVFRLYSASTYMGVQLNNGESFTLTENQINDLTSFVVYFGNAGGTMTDFMLNAGSTALPYSPYFNETVPVYLGQTQTVRRIRKLVLTGEERDWVNAAVITATDAYQNATAIAGYKREAFYCSHMVATTSSESATTHGYIGQRLTLCMDKTLGLDTADKFRAYLAAQYAAGTPVTVWYVLAEPETGIVNEPLAKIGDYADELHSSDAGVSIPTSRGENVLTVDTDLQPSSVTIRYKADD